MTKRWAITVEYDGAGFSGWQRQRESLTVQQVLEEALTSFCGESVTLHVAGRTDAGVHALAQVAHFDLEKDTDEQTICGAMNHYVRPHAVTVLSAREVAPDFHARFSAQARRYRYIVCNRKPPLALMRGRAWHVVAPLSLDSMRKAAKLLHGKHDFSTFRASGCQANSPLRTLDSITVDQQEDLFVFEAQARSFLYHQVRNMVGSLTLVGAGQWNVDDFAQAFAAADRTKGGLTAPADGLYFMRVFYDSH
ncbi:MAG: tRNA pseudouridine(38-40) synthase TruA [Alphaproteobacteria bacterium]|nr:tRNA pseudouridine(38-40) synthase TruA [Alphaproteobacteria bacterium]